jgi:hypothetical protein
MKKQNKIIIDPKNIENNNEIKFQINGKNITCKKVISSLLSENKPKQTIHLDPKGYFLIRIKDGLIECGQFSYDKKLIKIYNGKTADEIYKDITTDKAVSSFEHAAYLARELKKVEMALKFNIKYIQDEEITL